MKMIRSARKYSEEDSSQESGESSSELSTGKDNDVKTFPLISTPLAKRSFGGSKINSSAQHKQLFSSLQRLNSILIDIHGSCSTCCSSSSDTGNKKCPTLKGLQSQISIPTSEDKVSLEKLGSLLESVSELLKSEVDNFIKAAENDKTRLEQLENDNSILKQRLNTALNMQKNMEGELKQLSRENKLLEAENKNLAIKIVPYLPSNGSPFRPDISSKSEINLSRNEDGANVLQEENRDFEDDNDEDIGNNNTCEEVSDEEFQYSFSSVSTDTKLPCEENVKKDEKPVSAGFDPGDISAKFRIKENPEGFRPARNEKIEKLKNQDTATGVEEVTQNSEETNNNRQEELDSITSYVRWKTVDFGRLHGKLNKNFEEMQKLKQVMTSMSHEKDEILSDLEVLANSCRDLSRERDNYESILKMILREKNSPESNLRDLLDGLLHHLSGCCTVSSSPSYHHSAKCFLESALHVVQEQNISIREEMAKLKEALQRTSGQNCFLQSSNEILTGKVLELQKQLESKQEELAQNGNKDKKEKMEELYKEILSEKDVLNERLLEKERELEGLKKLIELKNKALDEQTDKYADLQFDNERMEKELMKYKANIEKMSQMVLHLKACLREQKVKWHDRVRSTSTDLQNTKQHCKWLQTQIDHLNAQLADAHERVKLNEKDKAILAQKVLTAEEERKTLDRKILEIKSIMHGDTVYREALAERNQDLEMEVSRLRKQKLMSESRIAAGGEGEDTSFAEKFSQHLRRHSMIKDEKKNENESEQDQTNNTLDELSSIASAPVETSYFYVAQTPTPSSPLLNRRHTISQNQNGLSSPIRKSQYEVTRARASIDLDPVECGII